MNKKQILLIWLIWILTIFIVSADNTNRITKLKQPIYHGNLKKGMEELEKNRKRMIEMNLRTGFTTGGYRPESRMTNEADIKKAVDNYPKLRMVTTPHRGGL